MSELKQEIDAQFKHVDERFASLEATIDAAAAETRRRFDVVAEHMRSDTKLLGSGLAATIERLDRSLAQNESKHTTLLGALDDHELRLRMLERSWP